MKRILSALLLVITAGCGDGPWEDRSYTAPVLSPDGSIVGVTIQRWQERQLSDPISDDITEECCRTFELRVLSLDGSFSRTLVEPQEGGVHLTQIFPDRGYALLAHGQRQIWLSDGSRDLELDDTRAGMVVGSPSGAFLAVLIKDEAFCEPTECLTRLNVLDALTHEVVLEVALPRGWPVGYPNHETTGEMVYKLRWLDDETVLVNVFLVRMDGTVERLEHAAFCEDAPRTASSSTTDDGRHVEAHLEGDDIVLDFTEPGTVTPWPGPCASLLEP